MPQPDLTWMQTTFYYSLNCKIKINQIKQHFSNKPRTVRYYMRLIYSIVYAMYKLWILANENAVKNCLSARAT